MMNERPSDELDGDSADALAAWSREAAGELRPPAELRDRLLATVAGAGRFQPFVEALRRTFDLGLGAIAELFRRVDDSAGWNDAPMPGIRYFHFTPGAAAAAFECGFVRVAPGATFPRHRHRGPEVTIIVDGVMHDGGRTYGPGAIVESAAGSAHDYSAGAGRDLILVSRHGGIDFEP